MKIGCYMNKKLEKASQEVMKEINHHFKIDGWDLDFSVQLEQIFYHAFGHNLEIYLLPKVMKKYDLIVKDGRLHISKKKRKKK